jgi:hypothetical protein
MRQTIFGYHSSVLLPPLQQVFPNVTISHPSLPSNFLSTGYHTSCTTKKLAGVAHMLVPSAISAEPTL